MNFLDILRRPTDLLSEPPDASGRSEDLFSV